MTRHLLQLHNLLGAGRLQNGERDADRFEALAGAGAGFDLALGDLDELVHLQLEAIAQGVGGVRDVLEIVLALDHGPVLEGGFGVFHGAAIDNAVGAEDFEDITTGHAGGQAPAPGEEQFIARLELDGGRAGINGGVALAVGAAGGEGVLGRAEHGEGEVDVVDAAIEEGAAALFVLVEPGGEGAVTRSDIVPHDRAADLAGLHGLVEGAPIFIEAAHETDLQRRTALLGGVLDALAVFEGAGQRLLAENGLAGFEAGDGDIGVQVRGQTDHNGIDFGQHFLIVGKDALDAILLDEALGGFLIDIGDAHELDRIRTLFQLRQMRMRDAARANETYFQL